jgi:hypothetical protein
MSSIPLGDSSPYCLRAYVYPYPPHHAFEASFSQDLRDMFSANPRIVGFEELVH